MKKEAQLTNELKKLQYQLSYSQHINRELSQHLATLYQKSGTKLKNLKGSENIAQVNFGKQLQQLYYIQPLLMAYQHKISLFEEQLKEMKEESAGLDEYSQELVKENAFLRKQLQIKGEFILKSEQVGINIDFLRLDNSSLTQKNKILNEKNEFLLQKVKQLSKSLQTAKKSQQSQLLINKLEKEIQKQSDLKKHIGIQVIQLKSKLQVLANQLNNEKAMNKENERKINDLENEVSKFKNDNKILKQQLQSANINSQYSIENLQSQVESLKSQHTAVQRRQSELFNKNMILQSDLNQKNTKLHNMTLHSTQLQTNNNNILQMLQSYESKVTNLNKKIKSLQSSMKQTSDTSTQQRKQVQILKWKLEQKQKQMQRFSIQNKRQRDRVNKMWQQRLQLMRRTFEQQKNRLYSEIKSNRD